MKEQKALEAAGDLWHSEKVILLLSEVYKHVKTSMNLFSDSVDREAGLTDKQKKIITRMTDALLDDAYHRLVTEIEEPELPQSEEDPVIQALPGGGEDAEVWDA